MKNNMDIETLQSFRGTSKYHEHASIGYNRILLTDGCNFVRERFEAYWLFDLILSYQSFVKFQNNTFQVWRLEKQKGGAWLISCTDGNDMVLLVQELEYSDFPIDDFKIWVVDGIAMLPTEY